jgi:hypothetical protein
MIELLDLFYIILAAISILAGVLVINLDLQLTKKRNKRVQRIRNRFNSKR